MNRAASINGNLVWTKGNILISNFTFDGKREQGEDVFFIKEYPSGLNLFFDQNQSVEELKFEIPQGNYTKIEISYKTHGDQDDKHIKVEGTYQNTINSTTYPVVFEFEAEEYYSIVAKTSAGNTQVTLDKDKASYVIIKTDPAYWFQAVSTNMMDNADISIVNSVQTIIINDSNNEDIYDAVRDRMDDDVTTATFYN